VDQHRFDAYPDQTFLFDADPDLDHALRFTHVGKSEIFR
jgi:hypothetical protein